VRRGFISVALASLAGATSAGAAVVAHGSVNQV
jgi:hypothetical protein